MKSNFYGYLQIKNSFDFYIISFKRTCLNCNFKKVASYHEKLYNEQLTMFYFYTTFLLWFLNNISLNNNLSNFKGTVSTQTEAGIESCFGK